MSAEARKTGWVYLLVEMAPGSPRNGPDWQPYHPYLPSRNALSVQPLAFERWSGLPGSKCVLRSSRSFSDEID